MRCVFFVLIWGLTAGLGCRNDPATFVQPYCVDDAACPDGFLCELGTCLPDQSVSCRVVEGGQAVLQPSPPLVHFGSANPGVNRAQLRLRNIGDCTVTIFDARMATNKASPFICPSCAGDLFPIELFPLRQRLFEIRFTPTRVGTSSDTLILESDDDVYPQIRIPLRAHYDGRPAVAATPNPVDFDFVAVGRTGHRELVIRNRGTGTASLDVYRIEFDAASASAFSFTSTLETPESPVKLSPITAVPPGTDDQLTVSVRYQPEDVADHRGTLLLHTNQHPEPTVRVPVVGSSKTPARIAVAPGQIALGQVPLGHTTSVPLTIVNEGGTPLSLEHRWAGPWPTTDLSVLPAVVPDIPAGGFRELLVQVVATAPVEINGLLNLQSNDPVRPTVTVPVTAAGEALPGVEVLKIDMSFDNGEDGVFDDDLRNVDLALENPFGQVVDKHHPQPDDWDPFGRPTWFAFGPKEEPERIVVRDVQQDGVFRVLLTYPEDCASVPSALVAAVLGISVEALIAYLTGGPTLGIGAEQVSAVIESLCLSRASSAVTLTISVNGIVIAEVPAVVNARDELRYATTIERVDDRFVVVQP